MHDPIRSKKEDLTIGRATPLMEAAESILLPPPSLEWR